MRLLALIAAPVLALAQMYPVAIEEDSLTGAADFSHLNHPLGEADRVFVRDGHFFVVGADLQPGTRDDERINFFGTNLAFDGNLPLEQDAARIAKRLRRLGFNLVRLHHLDTSPDANPENGRSILTTGPYPTLNPVSVRRLRAFLDALRAEGVYINLNLHVGYRFRPGADNVPFASPFPEQSKPVRIIHSRLISLQLEYVRRLLAALELRGDPALAMVEVSNETSVLYHWQNGSLDSLVRDEYRNELLGGWNQWLLARYETTEQLRRAWGDGDADGADLLPNEWRVENHNATQVRIEPGDNAVAVEAQAAPRPIIIKQVGFTTTTDRPYMAEIEMRASVPSARNVYWDVKQDVSPWRTLNGRTVGVTSEWQRFTMLVNPAFAMDRTGRFAVSIENVGARIEIRNARLYPLGRRTLGSGEHLESGNVEIAAAGEFSTEPRTNDTLRYLVRLDREYLEKNLAVVRELLGDLVPVAGTQMGYGGLLNLDSHDDLGYQDNHFYVDHYNFPSVAWDGRDWRFADTSLTGSGAAALEAMAVARQARRPYTVSEYNQAWPNTHGAEIHPIVAAFGRFQQWDGVMQFAYAHNRGWDNGVPNGFNITGDWARFVNLGQSALLFRGGLISEGVAPLDLPLSEPARYQAGRERRNGNIGAYLSSTGNYQSAIAFRHPVRLAKDAEGPIPAAAATNPGGLITSDTGEFTFDRSTRVFRIHAPGAAGVFGFAGKQPQEAGALTVEAGPSARGFVALLATSLDGESLSESKRILLTNPGFVVRTQPGTERPQEVVAYRGQASWWTIEPDQPGKPSGDLNGGRKPVWMERVELHIRLRSRAARLTVYPLNGAGLRGAPLDDSFVVKSGETWQIHLQADGQQFSPWYELIAE